MPYTEYLRAIGSVIFFYLFLFIVSYERKRLTSMNLFEGLGTRVGGDTFSPRAPVLRPEQKKN